MEGKRILALDYGTKRIGVALSDEWGGRPNLLRRLIVVR
jgi:Predicted endonuclease involved in recombination (possible Holliday junction resolvase in Mycoplasmas and B. subtilis)